jgi:sugar-phosphatase
MPFEAVIFDMDGVLVDSEPMWREVEARVFATVGIGLDPDAFAETMGVRLNEVVDHWNAKHPWPEPPTKDEIAARILDEMVATIRERGRPIPGAVDAVHAARRRFPGKVALASSSSSELIDATLGATGLRDVFDVIHSAEDEDSGKPHPAVFLSTAAKLHTDPAACIAVEDSPNGVAAAKAAGMFVIAIPDAAAPAIAEADLRLTDITELDGELARLTER